MTMGPSAMASPGRTTQLGDKMLTSMELAALTRELATTKVLTTPEAATVADRTA